MAAGGASSRSGGRQRGLHILPVGEAGPAALPAVRARSDDLAPPGSTRVWQCHAGHALLPLRLLRAATRLDERIRRDDPVRRQDVLPGKGHQV